MSEFEENQQERPSLNPPSDSADRELDDLASRIRILDDGMPIAQPSSDGQPPLPSTWTAPVQRPRPYPFWGWLDALVLALLVIAGLIGSGVVIAILGLVLGGVADGKLQLSLAQAAVIMQLGGFGVALIALSLYLKARYSAGLRKALQLDAPRFPRIFVYAVLGLATALFVAILGAVLRLQEMDMPMNEFIKSDADLIVIGIAAFTIGPLFEEMIFRGFLQPLFVKTLGVAGGILATSLLFTLPHGPQYGWHWQHLLIIVVAGSVFGVIRWRANSTTASTIAHAVYNGFLVSAAIIQRMNGMI